MMKTKFCFLLFFIFNQITIAQQGFQFESNKKKIVIPFKLINNLVFIPIKVNGVELNFLLDTGVEETILLSLDDKDQVSFNNVEKITLKGLGSDEAVEGLKSSNNILSINGLVDNFHTLYIVLDQNFNFSSHIGIPVNGIIGYHFFKNNLVEINYDRKKIFVYKDTKKLQEKLHKKFSKTSISIEKNKPYLETSVTLSEKIIPAKLLIDTGNSDALWLFQDINKEIQVPQNNFDDYLGKGFSGDIFGKRTRISKFSIDKFEFVNPIIAMPEANSFKSVNMVTNRVGSIGGEILKRFTVLFDYKNNQLFLNKNNNYNAPFHYNMSGIELQNEGVQWVQETIALQTQLVEDNTYDASGKKANFKYKFSLKPIYTISNIRKNSPAELSGLKKDDIVISINNVLGYKYSLQEINEILKSEEDKWLYFEIERDKQILKFKFQLKSIL